MLVFIYGSLKKGQSNHRFMEQINAVYAEDAVTARPEFDLADLGAFPGLVHSAYYVHGELYSIDKKGKRALDRFEGTPNFYYRDIIRVKSDFTEIDVFAYFLSNIPSRLHFVNDYYDDAHTIKVWRGR